MDLGAVVLQKGDVVQIQISGMSRPYVAEVVGFDNCKKRHAQVCIPDDPSWGILGDGDYTLMRLLYRKNRGP